MPNAVIAEKVWVCYGEVNGSDETRWKAISGRQLAKGRESGDPMSGVRIMGDLFTKWTQSVVGCRVG